MCTGEELLNVGELGRMTKAGHLVKGLERLLFAADSVYKRLCPEKSGVCVEFFRKGRQQIYDVLSRGKVDEEFEVHEFLPVDHHGNFGYETVANFSIAKGLKQITAYKTFVNGAPRPGFQRRSKCLPPLCKCFLGADPSSFLLNVNPSASEQVASSEGGSYVRQEPLDSGRFAEAFTYDMVLEQINTGNWRSQPASYVLLGLTSALVLIACIVLALVCIKTYFRVVKGNQSLGISLLVGVIMLFVAAYAFIFDPTEA
ncbi:Protein F35H10.10, partial [Aphelenchoides avenae]